MLFSKSEMQEELLKFLSLLGREIAYLYGAGDCAWTEKEAIQTSPIWAALNDLYDYGVTGTPTDDLLPGARINGAHANAEMFLRGIDSPHMRIYLEGHDNAPPRLATLAVQSAVARIVLDGGDRYTDFGAGEHGMGKGDCGYLTLAEIALLANMDERSVRNAANPKLPDPLKTEQIGKRSLVSPEEARRWLVGRKGYLPTKECGGRVAQRVPEYDIELTEEIVEAIERGSKKAGVSFGEYFKRVLIKTYEGIDK